MDDEDFGGAPPFQNRNQAFGSGMIGGQAMYSNSLDREAARYNAQIPRMMRTGGSLNGMSEKQYQATLGGSFPTMNGLAADNYEVMKYSMQKGNGNGGY